MKILLGFVVGLLALTGWSQQEFACSCAPPGSPSEKLERSTAVFSGRVVGLEVPSGGIVSSADPVAVTFEVYTVWKGSRSDRVTVTTARWSLSVPKAWRFEADDVSSPPIATLSNIDIEGAGRCVAGRQSYRDHVQASGPPPRRGLQHLAFKNDRDGAPSSDRGDDEH